MSSTATPKNPGTPSNNPPGNPPGKPSGTAQPGKRLKLVPRNRPTPPAQPRLNQPPAPPTPPAPPAVRPPQAPPAAGTPPAVPPPGATATAPQTKPVPWISIIVIVLLAFLLIWFVTHFNTSSNVPPVGNPSEPDRTEFHSDRQDVSDHNSGASPETRATLSKSETDSHLIAAGRITPAIFLSTFGGNSIDYNEATGIILKDGVSYHAREFKAFADANNAHFRAIGIHKHLDLPTQTATLHKPINWNK